MTNAIASTAVRLVADHAFYAEDGTLREWKAGEVVYDFAEIADLKVRGASVELVDADFYASGAFHTSLAERVLRLGRALAEAGIRATELVSGFGMVTDLGAPLDALEVEVRAVLDRYLGAVRLDIAAHASATAA